jgi:hypothetical protein
MRKRLLKVTSIISVILILGIAVMIWQNHSALAKKQNESAKPSAATRMAKYSDKSKRIGDTTIRKSRLNQINVMSEAANILNVLPINIMDEMKKGKTLEEIAIEKGMSKDKFLKKLTEYDKKSIDSAVSLGTISSKQGTALKEGQKDRLKHNLMLEAVDVNDHKAMDMNH